MIINFSVPGRPVPMARPRVVHNHAYTPKRCADYKEAVALAARAAMHGRKPLEGAVCVEVRVGFAIPKSWTKKRKREAEMGLVEPTIRPDLDNLYKGVTDAMSGIVYRDDAQIVYAIMSKTYLDENIVDITVTTWGDDDV